MSMPIISTPDNPIDREQSINDLIESVALMESGLSHVINAEGEKIQKVVDPDADYPLEDIINVNNSAEKMINTVSKLEMMLQSKLETSKSLDTGGTPGPVGPPGPEGPEGPPGVTETIYALSAHNSAQTVLVFPAFQTLRIPLETTTYSNGFTAAADNLTFTVENSGDYLANYFITPIINNGSSRYILRIFINTTWVMEPTLVISGTVPYPRVANTILHLEAGDTVSLGLTSQSSPEEVTLAEGMGASLVLIKIA